MWLLKIYMHACQEKKKKKENNIKNMKINKEFFF